MYIRFCSSALGSRGFIDAREAELLGAAGFDVFVAADADQRARFERLFDPLAVFIERLRRKIHRVIILQKPASVNHGGAAWRQYTRERLFRILDAIENFS